MGARPLASDTAPVIELRQIRGWRQMSHAEKAALVTGLTRAACQRALAGVRHRHPGAPPRDHFLRLAIVTLGPDLARRAYPEIARLDAAADGA